ncbi:hypothetical protein GGP41_003642 [Bipolaris sorokiniana]|uniref:Uncharacterized protein n=1 Tax=Cochliobolus sativus TaxID=45130 RepID=A0A8H5ZCS0_COCSA|nr:hypothetical protein GGP41_003642 [Bipolaris sorokiniana]
MLSQRSWCRIDHSSTGITVVDLARFENRIDPSDPTKDHPFAEPISLHVLRDTTRATIEPMLLVAMRIGRMVLHCAFEIVRVSMEAHSHYTKATPEQSPESPYSVRPMQLSSLMICIVLISN